MCLGVSEKSSVKQKSDLTILECHKVCLYVITIQAKKYKLESEDTSVF